MEFTSNRSRPTAPCDDSSESSGQDPALFAGSERHPTNGGSHPISEGELSNGGTPESGDGEGVVEGNCEQTVSKTHEAANGRLSRNFSTTSSPPDTNTQVYVLDAVASLRETYHELLPGSAEQHELEGLDAIPENYIQNCMNMLINECEKLYEMAENLNDEELCNKVDDLDLEARCTIDNSRDRVANAAKDANDESTVDI
jgi:hypothetical protein